MDGIIKKRSRLNSDAFVSHVDLDDLSFVNNHLEAGYEMPAKAGEDFTEWLSRIDSGALLDIEDFLNRKGFVYDYSGEPDVAFSCLFYYFLARRYAESKWNRILRGADPTKGLKRLFKLAW